MKIRIFSFLVLLTMVISGCEPTVSSIEQEQQRQGNMDIVLNQPVPDLGGWSFERHILIEVYKARNNQISTYTYTTFDAANIIIEICPSLGYPIPYSTQLTNPEKIEASYQSGYAILPNAEPNSLYSPESAEATIVNCVNEDGTLTPTYFENRVFALPFRIKSDRVLERMEGENSFSVKTK